MTADAPVIIGDAGLLAAPSVGVLSSRRCPPLLFFAAEAWAAAEPRVVVGGFQTPVEHEMLHARLRAGLPTVAVPARAAERMRLPPAWRAAIEAGTLAVASIAAPSVRRATAATAEARTRWLLTRTQIAIVVHAAPGSHTLVLARQAAAEGHSLLTFAHPENAPLIALGAIVLPTA